MQSPTTTREGDVWHFAWEENQIGVSVEFLREDDTGFYVEMHIVTLYHTVDNHLYRGRVNLTDPDRKLRLVGVLLGKTKGERFNWAEVLEIISERVLRDYRWGDKTIRLDEFTEPPTPAHLLNPILPYGEPTVLFADGGSGKSFLALGIAAIVSEMHCPPCGLIPLAQANVMYLDWETSPAEQKERLERIAKGLGARIPPVYYRHMYRPLASDLKRVRQEIGHYQIGLVIVDSLAAACGANPNDPMPVIDFFNGLRSLGDHVTNLVIAHISREGAALEGGRGNPFGSAFVTNMARSVWEVRRSEEEGETISMGLFHRKVNRGSLSAPLGIRIRFDDGAQATTFERYNLEDDPALIAFAPLSYRIRSALRSGAKTPAMLAEALGVKESICDVCVRKMKGLVRLTGGFWGLATHD